MSFDKVKITSRIESRNPATTMNAHAHVTFANTGPAKTPAWLGKAARLWQGLRRAQASRPEQPAAAGNSLCLLSQPQNCGVSFVFALPQHSQIVAQEIM